MMITVSRLRFEQMGWGWGVGGLIWYVCCSLPPCSIVLSLFFNSYPASLHLSSLWSVYKGCRTGRVWSLRVLDAAQEQQKQTVLHVWALSFFSSWAKFSAEVCCLFLLEMTYHSWGTSWTSTAPWHFSPVVALRGFNIQRTRQPAWAGGPAAGAEEGPRGSENDKERERDKVPVTR